jgi:hypothetical protein
MDSVTRNYATFAAEFPDTGAWDDAGRVLEPPGREVARYIREALTGVAAGLSEPESHEDFAWEFIGRVERAAFWVLLQHGPQGGWLLITELFS